jgi:aspartate/methionine/tyrosine aminotransferase
VTPANTAGRKEDWNMREALAINGGQMAVKTKLPGWPQFSEEAIQAVEAVLRSGKVNYWTGKRGMEFERRFAEWQGSKYAISVATGTAALHVGLAALGIGPGDEVIVPSYTFIATSFSVVQAGAIPRFADVNLEDHCISAESAGKLINERTKAIMPVHLYGNVCDMDEIWALAKRHGLLVVEDNAEAYGGEFKGKKTGTLGDAAGCSFCQNKTFTTGGRMAGPQFPRPRLRRETTAEPARTRAEIALHPQHGRLELSHDRDAVGHRSGRTRSHRRLELPRPASECTNHC